MTRDLDAMRAACEAGYVSVADYVKEKRMSEFGHNASIVAGACIDSWGVGPFIIEVNGKRFRFEDSDRFGPMLISKRGLPLRNDIPPERSPFWRAHFLWRRQGRQVASDGMTCIWREPKPTLYRIEKRGRKRFVMTVEKGEPDGREIDVTDLSKAPTP